MLPLSVAELEEVLSNPEHFGLKESVWYAIDAPQPFAEEQPDRCLCSAPRHKRGAVLLRALGARGRAWRHAAITQLAFHCRRPARLPPTTPRLCGSCIAHTAVVACRRMAHTPAAARYDLIWRWRELPKQCV